MLGEGSRMTVPLVGGAVLHAAIELRPAFITLQPLLLVLFSGFTSSRAISSVVERLLHTQEVVGSNPASRKLSLGADPQATRSIGC